jgi:hypothetical protein
MSDLDSKGRHWIAAGAVAGVLVIGSVYYLRLPQALASATPPTNLARFVATPQRSAVVSPKAFTSVSENGGEGMVIRIKADAVLATVNGEPIALKDLLPLEQDTTEQTMSDERYAFLLDRAIDRVLVFQKAVAQGVDLTELQLQQLSNMRARTQQPKADVFDDLQRNATSADFEERDAAAMLVQASLAENAGVPSRDVTPAQVEQYYQQHSSDFAALPEDPNKRQEAWEIIDTDIRVILAKTAQTLHDEASKDFIEQLRAAAKIVRTNPNK